MLARTLRLALVLGTLASTVMVVPLASADIPKITVLNLDGPNEGFNDPAVFTPVGGNPATTLGEARLVAFRHAAFIWSTRLNSSIEISVDAQMDPQFCTAAGAVLGSAAPMTAARDFPANPPPRPNTLYPIALANSMAKLDLVPGTSDIRATFNSDFGKVGCGSADGSAAFYYGLDGNAGSKIDFVSVVLHELGHGLGFLTFMNVTTGVKNGGRDDIFMRQLENHSAPAPQPKDLPSMTDAQRQAAVVSGDLRWVGSSASSEASCNLTMGATLMYAPNPVAVGSSVSHWDVSATPNELMEPRYTGANHDPGLALELLEDIGWKLGPNEVMPLTCIEACKKDCPLKRGADVLFVLDKTGSTGALIGGWKAALPGIADKWRAAYPDSRFALASQDDFPFSPYGSPCASGTPCAASVPIQNVERAYHVEADFDSDLTNLQAALNNLTQKFGNDEPESQWEAVYQALTGEGREFFLPVGDADVRAGEIPKQPLTRKFPMVIYYFTFPEVFHDPASEPLYPLTCPPTGANPPGFTRCTSTSTSCPCSPTAQKVLDEMANQSAANVFFGLTFITGPSSVTSASRMSSQQAPNTFPAGGYSDQGQNFSAQRFQGFGAPLSPMNPLVPSLALQDRQAIVERLGISQNVVAMASTSPLQRLADLTGGLVLDVSSDLHNLVPAIDASIAYFKTTPQGSEDSDGDGVLPPGDNCPFVKNAGQQDSDADGVGDACDNCPTVANPDQTDTDLDGKGNACETVGPPGTAVPAQGEAAMIALVLLVLGFAVWRLRRVAAA